jgi:hypothetical protein
MSIKRRDFIALLDGATAAWRGGTRVQRSGPMRWIGIHQLTRRPGEQVQSIFRRMSSYDSPLVALGLYCINRVCVLVPRPLQESNSRGSNASINQFPFA